MPGEAMPIHWKRFSLNQFLRLIPAVYTFNCLCEPPGPPSGRSQDVRSGFECSMGAFNVSSMCTSRRGSHLVSGLLIYTRPSLSVPGRYVHANAFRHDNSVGHRMDHPVIYDSKRYSNALTMYNHISKFNID